MEKFCRWCKQTKPISEFYKHPAMADGHLGKCKDCQKENTKAARDRHPEYYREYDKKRANLPHRVQARAEYIQTDNGKAARKKTCTSWGIKHLNRRAAHHILNNAIRDGKVKKHPCFICGKKAHAHHPDYDRPLDVTWLCPKHHKETHQLTKD